MKINTFMEYTGGTRREISLLHYCLPFIQIDSDVNNNVIFWKHTTIFLHLQNFLNKTVVQYYWCMYIYTCMSAAVYIVCTGMHICMKLLFLKIHFWSKLTDIHFQYNGFLYGILLLSITKIFQVSCLDKNKYYLRPNSNKYLMIWIHFSK